MQTYNIIINADETGKLISVQHYLCKAHQNDVTGQIERSAPFLAKMRPAKQARILAFLENEFSTQEIVMTTDEMKAERLAREEAERTRTEPRTR